MKCLYLVLLVSTFASSTPSTGAPTITPTVPLEFPSLTNQNYSFIDNSTIRKTLANHAAKNDTEVDNLLGLDNPQTTPIIVPNPSEENTDNLTLKNETELIEDDDEKTEDHKFDKNNDNNENRGGQGLGVFDGQMAAILIGSCLSICVVGYIALMIWRRYIEVKYGSRDILVNEEDFMHSDDLKHFSI